MSKHQGKVNCYSHLARIDKHIKLLQYQLSRIVTSINEFHIKLLPNATVNIDLIEQTPIYCKIDTTGKMPPLKIQIELQEVVTTHTRLLRRKRLHSHEH